MKYFISSQNVPLGYTTPKFPSLYWPTGPRRAKFQSSYLYYSKDIWTFTVYWSIIFFSLAYTIVAVGSASNMIIQRLRLNEKLRNGSPKLGFKPILVAVGFVFLGLAQGLISGAVVGLVLLALYRAGSLSMTTWTPMSWGVATILYHICSSYSTSLLLI